MLANLAVVIMGKVPVNLNFTAGRAALESCLRRGDLDTVITAEALKGRLHDFPWPENILDIQKELEGCSKGEIIKWLAIVFCIPSSWIARGLGVPREGNQDEAGLLFTSGSSGDPKGVVLSHRNILGNVAQIAATGLLEKDMVMMACLPLFHSFGFTVTLWYVILKGGRLVTLPSPLEVKKIAEAIHREKATVFLSTPTFLRPYLKKADSEQLQSLRLVVTGAEKLPPDLAHAFLDKFGARIMEGYGLTETSPVTSVNLPHPPLPNSRGSHQEGHRLGSVGRLLPGMSARIMDPESAKPLSLFEVGMLHVRGPNIFSGYLGDEEKYCQVVRDGWFITGDLARFDEDGFLYIEGRLSRFSKIGGEMVPHGTVEQKLIELLDLHGAEKQPLVVTGIPDVSKGESLVILSTADVTIDQVREKLASAGLPNLWIPKIVKRVDVIPTLASGKLNLKACENLAKE
jgi:acyl-[acyl-carrier-protein]-phospholipid O-acyltransferase/long-chain-fatty-acid--[acyl-carrier-protein] ligase